MEQEVPISLLSLIELWALIVTTYHMSTDSCFGLASPVLLLSLKSDYGLNTGGSLVNNLCYFQRIFEARVMVLSDVFGDM